MAIAWKDVINNPDYQALSPEQKAQAQEQYFNQVIAPQAGDKAEAAKQQFFSAYPLPTQPQQQAQPQPAEQQQSNVSSPLVEAGKGLLQAGVNVANIPAEIIDAMKSAGAWGAEKLGIGDGTYTPTYRAELPESIKPKDQYANIGAEIGPYLIPGIAPEKAASAAASAASRAERATTGATRLLAESLPGALASQSDATQNPSALAGELAQGVIGGAASNLAIKGAGAALGKIKDRIISEPAKELRNALTVGSQPSAIEETAKAISEAPEGGIIGAAKKIASPSGESASLTGNAYRAAEEVRPSQDVIDAAKRLGVDDLLIPSHYSTNPTYRAIEQGIKSIPSSQLAAQEQAAISAIAQKADDLITTAGGVTDKVALSDKFKAESLKAIDSLTQKSDGIYNQISKKIDPRTAINADSTISMLKSKADDLGGVQNLSPAERTVLSKLSGTKRKAADGTEVVTPATFALLDNTRKQIGAAISKGEGPFKDQTTSELKQLYSAITDDQSKVVGQAGLGDKWELAKSLVSQRKQLEDHMKSALGKDLSGSISSKIATSIQGARTGNIQQFNKLIEATPPHMRQEVVASALNDAFTLGSRKEQQLNIPGFVDWYSSASRKGSLGQITKHLPEDARKRLKDLYTVANGIRTAKSSEITTGRIQSLLDQFDKDGGMVSKLYNIGKRAAAAEGVTSAIGVPGVGAASVIASSLGGSKTARTVAADKLLASPQFRNATKIMATGDAYKSKAARKSVEAALQKTKQYDKWYNTLNDKEKREMARIGFIGWITNSGDSDKSKPQEESK